MLVQMEVGEGFEIEKAVCNHGFFMMAPNTWIPSTKSLVRPLRVADNKSVTVSISQCSPTLISISTLGGDQDEDEDEDNDNDDDDDTIKAILDQVRRMLRLSQREEEAIKAFHALHAHAARKGFGRLFRNPTLFEDIVKSLLLCACRFKDSLEMAESLCKQNRKRKRGRRRSSRGGDHEHWSLNFPTPQELSTFDRTKLNKRLGFRGDVILDFARDVASGKINLEQYSNAHAHGDHLYNHLRKMKGIGDFVSCNVLMCIGFYHRLPVDSETIRHIKQVHHQQCDVKKSTTNAMIKDIYDKYAPFQTLAYWFELLEYYESKLGKLSLLQKADYKNVTGSKLN